MSLMVICDGTFSSASSQIVKPPIRADLVISCFLRPFTFIMYVHLNIHKWDDAQSDHEVGSQDTMLTLRWSRQGSKLCHTGLQFSALIMWRLSILVREAVEDELDVSYSVLWSMNSKCLISVITSPWEWEGHMGPTGALGRLYLSVHCCSKLQNRNAMWWGYYGLKTRKLTLGEWKWFQTVCVDFQRSDFIIIRKTLMFLNCCIFIN